MGYLTRASHDATNTTLTKPALKWICFSLDVVFVGVEKVPVLKCPAQEVFLSLFTVLHCIKVLKL